MNKFSLAILASAAALAIAPAAMATTIAGGSSFTVSGNIPNTNSNTPVLTNVDISGGTGTFADIPNQFLSSGQIASDISLNSAVVGDTFTIPAADTTDGQTIVFTVDTVTFGTNSSAGGIGTITDTGGTNYTPDTDASWSETITQNGNVSFTFDTTVTPEPSSLFLLGTGLLGLAFVAFRKARSTGAMLSM